MTINRKVLLTVIVPALVLVAGSHPVAAPEFGEWLPPIMLAGPVNAVPSYGAVTSRDGLSLYLTRGSGAAADIYVSQRASLDELWGDPVKLAAPVNSPFTDMIPALSRDEHWLFFTSDRPGSQSWDLWASWRRNTKDDFAWQEPVNLGPGVNSIAQETTGSSFENDEAGIPLLFFASNRLRPGGTPPPGQLPIGHDIYVSALQPDGTFGQAVRDDDLSTDLGGVQDLEGRPMVRFDGREIIFVSDRPGAVGATDLWVATRDSVEAPWGITVNLAAVNTTAGELHPYLSPDGRTLYFTRRIGTSPYIFVTDRARPGHLGG
jgi:hypothetical protein